MVYFTDAVGLNPAFVGTLFLVARLWDAVNDPAMGMIVDNTRSKFGKFRPWIFIGTVLNAVVIVFLFRKPDLEGLPLYAYFSIMYILWGMTYTIMDIPWFLLPSSILRMVLAARGAQEPFSIRPMVRFRKFLPVR